MNKKKKIDFSVLPKLIKYLFKYYKKRLILVFILVLIVAAGMSTMPLFLQNMIDNVINPYTQGNKDVWPTFTIILVTMGSLFLVSTICAFLYTRIMAVVSQGFLDHLRKDMFSKMESLPIKYFDRTPHGDIMSRYTNDIDAVRQFISQTLIQVVSTAFTIIMVICMMVYYSVWLTLIVALGVVAITFISKHVALSAARYSMSQQKSLGMVEGFVEEMMNGQKVIKVFNHENESKEAFDVENTYLFNASQKASYYSNILMPILNNVGNILYIIVIVVGSILLATNSYNLAFSNLFSASSLITVGAIVSFLPMTKQFSQTIAQLSQQISMVAMALAGANRIFELFDEKEEVDDGYVTLVNIEKDENGNISETTKRTDMWAWKYPHKTSGITEYVELKGDILLDNVDFGYYENKQVLYGVKVFATPGQKIAFVGSTGAGKTTITNLINRFYDIQDGKVRYDGININKIKKADLRRSLGVVLQDTNLFTCTVMENIRYGRLDATDEEVYEAAKIANAYDFITRLPQGFNTMLSHDGSNLSQGQRQLLSIARAAVADCPVLVLDEATSSIDTRTEALVQAGMDGLMNGRTVFVIAHRLSTVRNSDCIMVLDHGHIIERGNHESLIAEKGTYYQLYTGAFEME